MAEYEITEGSFIEGDGVTVSQSVSDGRLVLYVDNANYELTLIGGEIEYVNRLSPRKEREVLLIAALSLLLIIAVIAAIVKRESIATLISIIKCRIAVARTKATVTDSAAAQASEQAVDTEWSRPVPTTGYNKQPRAMPTLPIGKGETPTDEAAASERENAEAVTDTEQTYEKSDTEGSAADTEREAEQLLPIDPEHADGLITDALAKDLVKRSRELIFTEGGSRGTLGIDVIGRSFLPGERVDVNSLKRKGLLPKDVAYLKITAGGSIDKPLSVYANEFTLTAVKMIALTGGEAIKVTTVREKPKK